VQGDMVSKRNQTQQEEKKIGLNRPPDGQRNLVKVLQAGRVPEVPRALHKDAAGLRCTTSTRTEKSNEEFAAEFSLCLFWYCTPYKGFDIPVSNADRASGSARWVLF
jgi:hypothetical protein